VLSSHPLKKKYAQVNPYAPIPSASGFGMGFGYLNTEPNRVFGALGKIGNYFSGMKIQNNNNKNCHEENCLHLSIFVVIPLKLIVSLKINGWKDEFRLFSEALSLSSGRGTSKLPSQNQFQPSVSNFQHLLKIIVLR